MPHQNQRTVLLDAIIYFSVNLNSAIEIQTHSKRLECRLTSKLIQINTKIKCTHFLSNILNSQNQAWIQKHQLSDELPQAILPEIISAKDNDKEYKKAVNKFKQQQMEEYMDENEDEWQEIKMDKKKLDKIIDEQKQRNEIEQNVEFAELEEFENDTKDKGDQNFLIYQHFINHYKLHVLRYCFDKSTEPLWFSDQNKFNMSDVPVCKYCKKKKQFEYQVNNSVLNFFKELYTQEWGCLYIYSCADSCEVGQKSLYEESVFVSFDDHEEQVSDTSIQSLEMNQEKKSKKNKKVQQEQEQKQKQKEDDEELEDVEEDDW